MSTTRKTSGNARSDREPLEAAVNAGRKNMETAMQAGGEAVAKGYEQAVGMSARQFEAAFKAGADAFGGYEDFVGFGKGNIDAVMQSSALFTKGLQDINAAWFGLAQTSMDESVAATRAMLGAKNIGDVVKMRMDFAKSNYEKVVGETRKISELSMKVAEEATSPITDRLNDTVGRFTKSVAA